MTTRMNVLLFISKKRINQKGLAPIYCRITIQGKRSEFSTGISVKLTDWSNDQVLNSHPQANVYNARLSALKTKLYSIQLNLTLSDQPLSPEIVKEIVCRKSVHPMTFVELMSDLVEAAEQNPKLSASTKFSYKIRSRNILAFLKHERKPNILNSEITIELCEKFQNHFREKKFTYGYINKHIFFFGQVLKHGIRKKIVKFNPLSSYQFTKDDPKKIVSLSVAEISYMMRYKFASEKLSQVRDLYLFQCNTGLSYCDLVSFDPAKHIHLINGKQWIIENRAKTNVEALIPIFKSTKDLLKKYNNSLPVISNQKYNQYIKEVAEVLGINKHLTTHTARKTFGMIKLNEGFSIESVSRMMGHNSTQITQKTYARVTYVRIENERRSLGIK